MEILVANLYGKPKKAVLNGRDYLVSPLTLIVPGVLRGSQGELLYRREDLSNNFMAWNHMPIVKDHPVENGVPVSARDPEILQRSGIGMVMRANVGKKLRAEGWFDVEATKRVDNRIYEDLAAGRPIELSTGLFTENVPAPSGTVHNGVEYRGLIATNFRPDHLAVLPDGQGACSLKDGCGVNVNANPNHGAGGKFASTAGGASVEASAASGSVANDTESARFSQMAKDVAGAKTKSEHTEAAKLHDEAADYHTVKLQSAGKTQYKDRADHTGAAHKHMLAADAHREAAKITTNEGGAVDKKQATKAACSASAMAGYNAGDCMDAKTSLDASAQHEDAAEKHEAMATTARQGGDEQAAMDNDNAAALHRKAASLHTAAITNEGGIVQTVNKDFSSDAERKAAFAAMADSSGSGKAVKASKDAKEKGTAKAHKAAAEAHRDAADKQEDDGEKGLAASHRKAASYHDKMAKKLTTNAGVDKLIANCKCEKDKELLKQLSPETLATLNTSPSDLSSDIFGVDSDSDSDAASEGFSDSDGDAGRDAPTGNKRKAVTSQEWLNSAPTEIRGAVLNAMNVEKKEKLKLVRRLVANAPDSKRKELGNKYMQRSMDELTELVSLMPAERDTAPALNYAGAAGGSDFVDNALDQSDILVTPGYGNHEPDAE